jgi:hypothetical protein
MRILLLLVACAHHPPSPQGPVGRESRPYTSLPSYLQHPVAEHVGTPSEQLDQMSSLLRDIDADAAELAGRPEERDSLRDKVDQLSQVVPPTPDMLVPVERMRHVVEDMPSNPPEATKRRLWSLTDIIRLRAHF